ncbi:MAG: hypothetical protein HOE48_24630 [Candidatus Latescibacteria bacterium]|nr:hypothetical protein [Candidatus Latescibacterota bacterium]MBT4141117.1 hypothetical protein [Candidatus Latescibacterota bacterium]MBT5831992.1 hypothetical protein [Candidatus Latescibacterota bacterium]
MDVLRQQSDRLQPIEIKSGQTLNRDFFANMQKWMDLVGDIAIDPTLIYGGQESQMRLGIQVHAWHDPTWQEATP